MMVLLGGCVLDVINVLCLQLCETRQQIDFKIKFVFISSNLLSHRQLQDPTYSQTVWSLKHSISVTESVKSPACKQKTLTRRSKTFILNGQIHLSAAADCAVRRASTKCNLMNLINLMQTLQLLYFSPTRTLLFGHQSAILYFDSLFLSFSCKPQLLHLTGQPVLLRFTVSSTQGEKGCQN